MPRVSSDNTIGQLIEAKQVQATPLINHYRRITSGNLVLDQGDQPHSFPVPEAHRKIYFTSDGVGTVSEHSLTSQQQSRTGVPFLGLALAPDQNSDGSSISTPTTMSDQGSVGGTTSYFTRNVARTESEVLAKQVVVPKYKRGISGSREFGIHYLKATVALEQVFGVARNFVTTSQEE